MISYCYQDILKGTIYIGKITFHYNSKNIARILPLIMNYELKILNCEL
ncbi:hypothetical protein BCD96_001914 [Clostridium beijerinckii]|nr:hypothetical protein [Clostridium beijerinckii]NRT34591.1 hypothetical protein [Clostridium beijerinckii]NRT45978.1 hypothetical protein [Clostridium beijerinckii]NRU39700.1 hypothetical protein [Clostridium beijerinckii]NRZ20020.1 hypothetical protein [Clostridium beijerinckii]